MAIRRAQPGKPQARRPKLAPLPTRKKGQPLWQYIVELGNSLPKKDQGKFPTDGAANHDHYIYGSPKQYE
jgi:hypothetical protein